MADGSIRIEATVSDEQAKKQIAQMTKDIEKQSAAVDKQAAKVQKLAEQWNKVAAGGTKGIKMQADLAATEKEAARLAARLDEVNAEIEKAQSDYNTKLKQAATGAIPQEEFSESAKKLNSLVAESDKLGEALRNADDKAAQLKQQLAEIKQSSTMSSAGQNVRQSLDNETTQLGNMKAGLKQSKSEMNDFVSQTNSKMAKLKRVVAGLGAGLKTSVGSLQNSLGGKLGAAIDKLKAKFANFGRTSQKSMKKATGGVQSFGVRLRSIVAGALFFNLISKALTAMADRLGKALLANKTFAKSFGQVKSNLLTAFQPIYESIIPWLNKLMQALAQVTAQMAQFIASVFGTTAQQAQENAKELNKQTDALDSTASSAKKAEKALASFDTVQKLTNNSNNTTDPSAPKFDTDYSAVKNQTPQWLTDFWKVFQDSWAQYGQQTIESAKNALSALKDMVSAIGQSFMAIWTNGTGLETLNNIQLLLQTIFNLITAIATAFTNAWNTNNTGEQMLQSIMNLLNTIIQIITSIGQAFIAAWNDGNAGQIMLQSIMTLITTVVQAISAIGQAFLAAWNDGNAGQTMINTLIQMITAVVNLVNSIGQAFIAAWSDAGLGESIFSNILSIITNIENTIKSLAENLQSAWEYNGNGVAIWESILKIIDDVLAGIDKMSQATADWASGLNFEPLVTAFNNFMAALEPVVDLIVNGLAWAWENVLLPLASWTIEEAAPAILNLLAAALQAVYKVVSALAPILQTIWSIIKPIVQFIGFSVISIIKGLTDTITKLGDALSFVINLISKIGSGIGSGISSLVGALGGGLSAFSLDSPTAAYALDIPALANGAVISPNSEFLALLGDQKSGVNIETPLSTMIDAFNAALDARGGTGNSSQPIELYIDGAKFARITGPYNSGETRRRGVSLVTGGA
jgi:phage-related protein|nr:MAG TPA: minor tail protein [Caudoviricetes sp.]